MTKEGFTKLTGLKPTDEEFEIINGLYTGINETAIPFLRLRLKKNARRRIMKTMNLCPKKTFVSYTARVKMQTSLTWFQDFAC